MMKGFTGDSGTCGLNLERHLPPAVEAMGSETKHPSDSGTSDRTNCRGEL